MRPVTDLPNEVWTRIFTIGTEDHSSPWQTRVRHLKPPASSFSLVCHRWHAIVYAKSNYHFWQTTLTISLTFDICSQATRFRDALLCALYSDIELFWYSGRPMSQYEETMTVFRIGVHLLTTLIDYRSQLTDLSFYLNDTIQCSLISSFLATLGNATRLRVLRFQGPDNAPTTESLQLLDFSNTQEYYDFDDFHETFNIPGFSTCCKSLSTLELNIELPTQQVFSPPLGLTHLSLGLLVQLDPHAFTRFMSNLTFLHFLSISSVFVFPKGAFVAFPSLQRLDIEVKDHDLMAWDIFSASNLPKLEWLRISLHHGNSRLSLPQMSLPQLNLTTLELVLNPMDHAILSSITMPLLDRLILVGTGWEVGWLSQDKFSAPRKVDLDDDDDGILFIGHLGKIPM